MDDFIDDIEKDLESHRIREHNIAFPPTSKMTKQSNPSGKIDLDELDFGLEKEKSFREETGLDHSKWADEQEQDKAMSFEQYKLPDDSIGQIRQQQIPMPTVTIQDSFEKEVDEAYADLGLSKTTDPDLKPREMQKVGVVKYVKKRPYNDSSSQLKIINYFDETKMSDPASENEKTIVDNWDRAD